MLAGIRSIELQEDVAIVALRNDRPFPWIIEFHFLNSAPDNHINQPKICPVCGKASYSSAGIHPQCAVTQADRIQKEKIQEKKQKEKDQDPAKSDSAKQAADKASRWQKTCPQCKVSQHVRKKECACGHKFQ